MKAFRLRSYETNPPGGFPYVQPDPKSHSFSAQPQIEFQARIVLSYRNSNGLPRSTYAECIEDIDRYTCARMGNNPTYCIPCNPEQPSVIALASTAPGIGGPCTGCGAKVMDA
jgi:hypothetical protein